MYCPPDVNAGFIQLVGPILQQDLNSITVKSYPLSIAFAPRTTPPTLIGNRIDESTENTCTYKGNRFTLVDTQICSVMNKGYQLPGSRNEPQAELIMSFSANSAASSLSQLSGILLCVPIYVGEPSHNEYLNQIIKGEAPSCKYNLQQSMEYSGTPTNSINNYTLSQCINFCCEDPSSLAFTYKNGTCLSYDSIPPIGASQGLNTVSGTVNHNVKAKPAPVVVKEKCTTNSAKADTTKAVVPSLETIFYSSDDDTTQSSFAYKTCFETFESNGTPSSRSLYVVVFPNGITLSYQVFNQLILELNINLLPYMVPPAIRGGDSTLRGYKYDDDGNKVPTITSQDGIIYATPLSSCTDEFRHRFEYFTLPPRLPNSKSAKFNTEQCPYYKTTQYKCMPFNQLSDLSGEYVIPGNKTLDTILYEQQQSKQSATADNIDIDKKTSLTTEQIEGIIAGVAGIAIAGIILLKVGSWISKNA
jgi:hypothetical protein